MKLSSHCWMLTMSYALLQDDLIGKSVYNIIHIGDHDQFNYSLLPMSLGVYPVVLVHIQTVKCWSCILTGSEEWYYEVLWYHSFSLWRRMVNYVKNNHSADFVILLEFAPSPPPSYFTCLCTCEKLSGEYFLKITTSACVVFSAVPEIGACSLYTTINGDRCKVTALGARVMRSECSFNGRFERESRIFWRHQHN